MNTMETTMGDLTIDDLTMTMNVGGIETGPFSTDQLRAALDAVRGRAPMKETEADAEVRDAAYRVTAAELRAFVERFERLEAETKDVADQQKEVMAEAKGRGYDTKVLRKLIALRKREPADVSEEEAILQLYRAALGC